MRARTTSLLIFVNIILSISFVRAAEPSYYTVHDGTLPQMQDVSMNPLDAFSEVAEDTARKVGDMDLMSWDHHQETLPDPTIPYNRKTQYGTWVRDSRDKTCYNTRAKVLIRSSSTPVSFSGRSGCTVRGGQWLDPYSNRQYTDAADLQIDHVVPLKNSYISGAWKWDGRKRCLYANFMSNEYHLLAVNGADNMAKGDRTPAGFMPSNRAFSCEYLSIWLKIKLIWNLALTPSEAEAIRRLASQNHCDSAVLSMATLDLQKQRQGILENMSLCAHK